MPTVPQDIIDIINLKIVTNNNNEITAIVLNPILVAMVQQYIDLIGDLNGLNTTEKTNLVGAINDVLAGASGLNDVNPGTGISIDKTDPNNPVISLDAINSDGIGNESDVNGNSVTDALNELLNSVLTPIINYTSIKVPQVFNPDAQGVIDDTDDFTLSSSNIVVFITHNGQVLNNDEFNLVGTTLTVFPDNGFIAEDDEILVFQYEYSTVSKGEVHNWVDKDSNYPITVEDRYINCTANSFDVTLADPTVIGAGRPFTIFNSGSGVITLIGTVNGEVNPKIYQGEVFSLVSSNAEYKLE